MTAHKTLKNVSDIQYAALKVLQQDGRFTHLLYKDKLKLINAAIDHVYDNRNAPKKVWAKNVDTGKSEMGELWLKLVRHIKEGKVRS